YPGRISLPGVDNGSREIEGKRRRVSTVSPHRTQRNRRVGSSLCGTGIDGRDLSRPREVIKIGGAVILNDLIGDALARLLNCVNQQIRVGLNRGCVDEPEKGSELFVRTHCDQIPTCFNPIAEHSYLNRREWHFAEYS